MDVSSQRGKVIPLKKQLPKIMLLLCELIILYLIWQFWTPETVSLQEDSQSRLAVWMGVTWSMDDYSDSDLLTLAQDLSEHGVDDAYVYVSYLRADDTFNLTYDEAQQFVTRMRDYAPEIRWFAWIGVPIQVDERDNRLEDPVIRAQIANFANMTVTELGFDGVHLNAELIPNNDSAFLQTLSAIREQIPENAVLSTSAHALRPQRPVTSIPYPHAKHHWTSDFLQEVATLTDQIAVMAYDSPLPFPRDYRSWVRYQVEETALALENSDTELLIGLPGSEEWTVSHQTQAETLANAIHGFNNGFSARINGIAIYPYWETTEEEWALIQPGE